MTIKPKAMRSVCIFFTFTLLHFSYASTVPRSNDSDREFSLREFYSIKNALSQGKASTRGSATELEAARAQTQQLSSYVPRSPEFYGQDHYERTRNEEGKETWIHVGRPDELVYHLFFRAPLLLNGTFVETGAGDGVKASNSLFFEEELGWKGLLVEGSRENFVRLAGEKRRRQSVKTFAAICESRGTTKFVGDGNAAGAVEDMTRHHVESWGRHFQSLDVYDVPCDRMDALMARAKMPKIVDLWSIDIEGGEWRALNSFDWKRHSVRVLVIEMGRSCFEKGRNRCEELLKERGFCKVAKRAVNEFWTSDASFKAAYCSS